MIWGYMFIVIYFFVSASIGYNNEFIGIVKAAFKVTNEDIRRFIGKSILYFIMCLIGLFLWKVYNTKRYGHLNRREHPPNTLDQEMIELGLVQGAVYHRLQNEQVIIFEKNPIKDVFEVD